MRQAKKGPQRQVWYSCIQTVKISSAEVQRAEQQNWIQSQSLFVLTCLDSTSAWNKYRQANASSQTRETSSTVPQATLEWQQNELLLLLLLLLPHLLWLFLYIIKSPYLGSFPTRLALLDSQGKSVLIYTHWVAWCTCKKNNLSSNHHLISQVY